MRARIFKPSRTATQSGMRKTRCWRLEFEQDKALEVDPLMGWTSSSDTTRQIRLDFPTREDAVAYAVRQGLDYWVEDERSKKEKRIAYADNFRSDRAAPWTH